MRNLQAVLKKKNKLTNIVSRTKPMRVINTKDYVLKIWPNSLKENRFGFIVSKKIDKRATRRNKTKRLLRACIEEISSRIKTGFDFLFIAKKSLEEKPKHEMEDIFLRNQFLK